MKLLNRTCFVFVLVLNQYCYADIIHFAKWIKIKSSYPWDVYSIDTILLEGLNDCVERCKATTLCRYVNYNVRASMCFLVAVNTTSTAFNPEHHVERQPGYSLGRKTDWNMDQYEICNQCEPRGACKRDVQATQQFSACEDSGCGPPEEKQTAVLNGNMFSIGAVVKYQCKEGYTDIVNGTVTSTCQISGNWTQTDIRCKHADGTACLEKSCYVLELAERQWDDAKTQCENLGGYLSDIKTEVELDFLTSYVLPSNDNGAIWLGGNDKERESDFRWLDGTAVSEGYDAWGTGQPDNYGGNQHCMATKINGINFLWFDRTCSMKYSSLCEVPPNEL